MEQQQRLEQAVDERMSSDSGDVVVVSSRLLASPPPLQGVHMDASTNHLGSHVLNNNQPAATPSLSHDPVSSPFPFQEPDGTMSLSPLVQATDMIQESSHDDFSCQSEQAHHLPLFPPQSPDPMMSLSPRAPAAPAPPPAPVETRSKVSAKISISFEGWTPTNANDKAPEALKVAAGKAKEWWAAPGWNAKNGEDIVACSLCKQNGTTPKWELHVYSLLESIDVNKNDPRIRSITYHYRMHVRRSQREQSPPETVQHATQAAPASTEIPTSLASMAIPQALHLVMLLQSNVPLPYPNYSPWHLNQLQTLFQSLPNLGLFPLPMMRGPSADAVRGHDLVVGAGRGLSVSAMQATHIRAIDDLLHLILHFSCMKVRWL
jgi:hypothetical protein